MSPGWYSDPFERFDSRWWDGARWTDAVSTSGKQVNDPSGTASPIAQHTPTPRPNTTLRSSFRALPAIVKLAALGATGLTVLVVVGALVIVAVAESEQDTTTIEVASAPVDTDSEAFTTDAAVPRPTESPVISPNSSPETSTTGSTTLTTESPAETATTTAPSSSTSTCFDDKNDGAGNFDLLNASISRTPDRQSYVFSAVVLGPWQGRFGGIAFVLDDFNYLIAAGQTDAGDVEFSVEDGVELTFGDPERGFFSDGRLNIEVASVDLPRLEGKQFDWSVVVDVDSFEIDECLVTAFGTTGSPSIPDE